MEHGDIWSTGAFAFESPLKDLLDSLDFTLVDLLREDELLQELRGLHPQLITFFSTEESVAGLIRCLVAPPPPSYEEYCASNSVDLLPTEENENDDDNENISEKNIEESANDPDGAGDDSDLQDVDISTDADAEAEAEAEANTYSETTDLVNTNYAESSGSLPRKRVNWLLDNITEAANAGSSSTTNPISREEYEARYIRYPYMACEVICCEVTQILNILVEGTVPIFSNDSEREDEDDNSNEKRQSILDLLFSMLFTAPAYQLDDRRAGYLEKILTMLFRKKQSAMAAYINGDHKLCQEKSSEENGDLGEDDDDCDYNKPYHNGGGIELLKALFNHLHSSSISQIVQRLLMPKYLLFASNDNCDDSKGEGNTNEWGFSTNDDDEDEEDCLSSDLDEFGGINCDWADNDVGINLLLDRLMVYFDGGEMFGTISIDMEADALDVMQLNISQNASEILTAIIQHSPLSSNVMNIVTAEPTLTRLIKCAGGTTDDEGQSPPTTFSRHESAMTTAMHVLETLVLQLGGYGTVPPTSVQNECDDTNSNNSFESSKSESKLVGNGVTDGSEPSKEIGAKVLIKLLPDFLSNLADLLTHEDTSKWQSHFQYSMKTQKLLGSSRLRIVRLLESLILLSIQDIDLILCGSNCLEICLDLFWDFPWCSMLHQSVANLLVHVLEGGEQRIDLQIYFLTRCNLPKRLMGSFDGPSYSTAVNDEEDEDEKSMHDCEENVEKMSYSAVLSMKNLENHSESSSVDVELGSNASTTNEGDAIPVSDDDVDAAIEQEEQLKIYHEENEEKKTQAYFDEDPTVSSGTKSITPTSQETKDEIVHVSRKNVDFRLGYMGHVIIICQALVHACGSTDQPQNVTLVEEKVEQSTGGDEGDETNVVSEEPPSIRRQRNIILSLMKGNRHFSLWQTFVTTTLASETAVQSTPLGGYNEEDNNAEQQQDESTKWDGAEEYDEDNDDNNLGSRNTNYVVSSGDIDLDDTDLDIAASMMESMGLPSSEESSKGTGKSKRHHRQRGVISGDIANGNGADFGTVVQMHQDQKVSGGYVYDDPLGAQNHFDDSDEDEENECLDENADSGNEAPVMDLFAGNFDFDNAVDTDGDSQDTGWANFDDAFGELSGGFPSADGDRDKSTNEAFQSQVDPFPPSNDLFGMISDSANISSVIGDRISEEFNNGGPIMDSQDAKEAEEEHQ